MKRVSRAFVGLPILGTLLWIPFVLGACTLPTAPGCSAESSLPRDSEIFLNLLLATEDTRGASFAIDREGRSHFAGGYTVWMLTPFRTCRTISSGSTLRLQDVWRRAVEAPGENAEMRPNHPFLALSYRGPAGQNRHLYVKPDRPGQSLTLQHAVALTAHTLQETYGDRVLREFQAANLHDLLTYPSMRSR